MDRGWSSRIKAGGLLLTTALSGVVALEVTGQVPIYHSMPPAPPTPPLQTGPVLRPLQPPVLETIDDMLDRPLFVMSRRPAATPDDEPSRKVQGESASDLLELVGTIHTDTKRLALFRHHQRGMLRKRLGEEIEGWRVARIDEQRVHLKRGSEGEWLTLSKPPSTQTNSSARSALSKLASAGQAARHQRSVD